MISREAIYGALFALGAGATWADGAFITSTRKFKDFSYFQPDQQPVFVQMEHKEAVSQKTGTPYKRTFYVSWIVYLRSDPNDLTDIASSRINAMLDALESALEPSGPETTQTLGGMVHHAFISGDVIRASGDIAGQGILEIPIQILVP